MHTHQVIGLNASHARAAGWPAACGAPTRLRVAMAALALASLSTPLALAAPAGVSTGSCEVLASGQLRSNEYVASYEGNCKAGLAQGQGKAVWQLRHAPQAAPVVWQGRFTQGVFLAEPEVQGAKRVDSTRVLLDLGNLKGPGHTGRLWVESRVDGKLPAQACTPISLQVSAQGPLTDDAVAKQWLQSANQRWRAVCGAEAANAQRGRNLRIQLRDGGGWAPDSFGNLPADVVQAVTPFVAGAGAAGQDWQQYTNRAAQQLATATREQQRVDQASAGQARLQAFVKAQGASRFVNLQTLEQNPFRFGNEVLLVAVQMTEARTPSEGVVRNANRGGRDCCTRALVQGDVRNWDAHSRVVAVRVKGRKSDTRATEVLLLEALGSQVCTEADCEDVLRGPQGWLKEGAL